MRVLAPLAVALTLGFAVPAQADAMRCGSRLVREEDARSLVREFCGEPADVQTRTILRRPTFNVRGRLVHFGDALVEVPVEVWTYNFGPYKLMRRVTFVNGLVDEIETLGYGYHAAKSADPDAGRRETYK